MIEHRLRLVSAASARSIVAGVMALTNLLVIAWSSGVAVTLRQARGDKASRCFQMH